MVENPYQEEVDTIVTHAFLKRMRDAVTGKSKKKYKEWHVNYALNHREQLKQLISGDDMKLANYAIQVLKKLPPEQTIGEKVRDKLRNRFEHMRNYIHNRLPDRLSPFKFP